jgi:hypothetical protein
VDCGNAATFAEGLPVTAVLGQLHCGNGVTFAKGLPVTAVHVSSEWCKGSFRSFLKSSLQQAPPLVDIFRVRAYAAGDL